MTLDVTFYPDEERLDLTVEGNLDLTLTSQMLIACEYVNDRLLTCVIDATRVTRVFDSGLALLMLLASRLAQFRASLIVIGDVPGLRRDSLPTPLISVVG